MTASTAHAYRFRWLDYSRGLTILMVVFVHMRNGLINFGLFDNAEAFVLNSQAFTTATMPLFFFMSGMFVRSTLKKPLAAFLADKGKTLAYPYFLWSILYLILAALLNQHTTEVVEINHVWRVIYLPTMHLWFFYTLFCVMLLFALLHRAGVPAAGVLAFAVILNMIPDSLLKTESWKVLGSVCNYLPYFAVGTVINRGEPTVRLSQASMPILISLVTGGLFLSWWGVNNGWRDHEGLILLVILPNAVAILSLGIILERLGRLRIIPFLGQHSLEIFVAHVLGYSLARVFLYDILGIDNLLCHIGLGMVAGLSLPILMQYAAKAVGFNYLFSLQGLELPNRRTNSSPLQRE